jgi:hypothetical protein
LLAQPAGTGHQQVQFGCPEGLELFTQPDHPGAVQAVEPVPAIFPGGYEPHFREKQQMLGNGRPADRKVAGQLSDRLLALRQEPKQRPPVGLR